MLQETVQPKENRKIHFRIFIYTGDRYAYADHRVNLKAVLITMVPKPCKSFFFHLKCSTHFHETEVSLLIPRQNRFSNHKIQKLQYLQVCTSSNLGQKTERVPYCCTAIQCISIVLQNTCNSI